MTQENVIKASDILFKIGVPLLLFLLGLIGRSISSQLDNLSSEIRSLQSEMRVSIEEMRVEQAVMREKIKLHHGG